MFIIMSALTTGMGSGMGAQDTDEKTSWTILLASKMVTKLLEAVDTPENCLLQVFHNFNNSSIQSYLSQMSMQQLLLLSVDTEIMKNSKCYVALTTESLVKNASFQTSIKGMIKKSLTVFSCLVSSAKSSTDINTLKTKRKALLVSLDELSLDLNMLANLIHHRTSKSIDLFFFNRQQGKKHNKPLFVVKKNYHTLLWMQKLIHVKWVAFFIFTYAKKTKRTTKLACGVLSSLCNHVIRT